MKQATRMLLEDLDTVHNPRCNPKQAASQRQAALDIQIVLMGKQAKKYIYKKIKKAILTRAIKHRKCVLGKFHTWVHNNEISC